MEQYLKVEGQPEKFNDLFLHKTELVHQIVVFFPGDVQVKIVFFFSSKSFLFLKKHFKIKHCIGFFSFCDSWIEIENKANSVEPLKLQICYKVIVQPFNPIKPRLFWYRLNLGGGGVKISCVHIPR